MKTALLRLAERHRDGTRYWVVPGVQHRVKAVPAARSFWNVLSVYWPYWDDRRGVPDWTLRGARLDWHRAVVKAEIRSIIARYCA